MSDAHASLLADSLVQADLRGIAKLMREGVNPRGRRRVVSQTGGAMVLDGDSAMGLKLPRFGGRLKIAQRRRLRPGPRRAKLQVRGGIQRAVTSSKTALRQLMTWADRQPITPEIRNACLASLPPDRRRDRAARHGARVRGRFLQAAPEGQARARASQGRLRHHPCRIGVRGARRSD